MVDTSTNEGSPFLMPKGAKDPTTKKRGYTAAAATFTVVLSVLLLTTFSAVQYYFTSGGDVAGGVGAGAGAADVRASLVSSNSFEKSSMTDGGDPNCNDDTAPKYESSLSTKLNNALDADGFIFRSRFDGEVPCSWTHYDGKEYEKICTDDDARPYCNSDGICGVAATFLSNQMIAPNPAYCLQDGCDKPLVGYAVLDNWAKKGGNLEGYAYYPTDANSVDSRDWQINGIPGRGCHIDGPQNFLCNTIDNVPSHCITYDTYYCKCDFDNFDPDYFGDYVVNDLGGNQNSGSYDGQDATACWIEEVDDLSIIARMQNSLYLKREQWWNGAMAGDAEPCDNFPCWLYQGWNEVAFDANIDYRDNKDTLEALVVVLPTGIENLCEFDYDAVQFVDDKLKQYWVDGYGELPVVIMQTTNENGDGFTYQKNIFVQSFNFASGNCIRDDGSGYLTYTGNGSGC